MRINGKRVCYWLNIGEPNKDCQGSFRVCLVTEDEPGYAKMGNESKGQAPWYWDEETCTKQNKLIGNTPIDVAMIISSSMGAQNDRRARRSLPT